MDQEKSNTSALTLEQIANTRRVLDRISKLPDSQQPIVYMAMLAYTNGLEVGMMLTQDCKNLL